MINNKSRTQVQNINKKPKQKSNSPESKPKKSKKIKQKCVNAFNDYYYDHFIELSQKAASQRQVFSQIIPLRNIASSIKKYPFPIVSLEQANLLQGIGEHFIGKFKKLIEEYKSYIKENKIDYVSLAFKVKPGIAEDNLKKKRERSQKSEELNIMGSKKVVSFSNPGTKKASKLKEIKAEAKKLKFKNNLINIELYSSLWTTAVCCYISFFDKETYDVEYNSIIEYGKTLKNKFNEFNIQIKEPNINEGKNDIEELKNLKLIDSIKKHKVTINDYLIKLIKIELEKIGLTIEKNHLNQTLEYTKSNTNDNNLNDIYINGTNNNNENNDDPIKNNLLEEYIDFMKYDTQEKNNS